ncbi:AMP-binding protein [Conexibacter arvalis]|uniref:Crotonobetaine/carnitine-CoA ligase n=1 Tax=Conexibacter arvalis TaxID=912552 RepID=A0A840IDL9_9ACTN|nr:crotonobetaine/carnitine-CoA ligase [Conexibacter arvalis]
MSAPAERRLSAVADRTVLDVLAAGAAQHPRRELLVFDEIGAGVRAFTWEEVLERSLGVAQLLAARGVGRGDRVHLHMGNRPEFLFTWFGCAALGAAIVPTNTLASPAELSFALEHSGAVASVTEADGEAAVREAAAALARAPEIVVRERDGLLDPPPLDAGSPLRAGAAAAPDRDLGLLYTSGTTSRPKGVRITHANYVYAGEVVARNLRLSPADRILTVLPLFHANAQFYTTMGALVSRATLVLVSRFSASRVLGQAVAHRATVASLFAAPIRMILAQPRDPRWREHRLRAVLFAQNLTSAELAAWEEAVGAPLLQLYGMTETIGPPLMNPLDDVRRPDAIGRVTLGYTCRVVREDGAPAAVGEVGDLHVHGIPGLSLMRGYLDDEQATAEALQDGWLRTGDVVRVEPDGFLAFVDRSKDMIKRAGENVAASEVEHVLRAHPGVADAAVFGLPDPLRDEQIVAVVVPREEGAQPAAQELIDWCAQRLARFRVPSRIALAEALPRTSVGKIQKHLLRDEWLAADGGER